MIRGQPHARHGGPTDIKRRCAIICALAGRLDVWRFAVRLVIALWSTKTLRGMRSSSSFQQILQHLPDDLDYFEISRDCNFHCPLHARRMSNANHLRPMRELRGRQLDVRLAQSLTVTLIMSLV